ncbi:MAG: hypothetical protein OXU20_33455 [Myxococcales bacterium]|nr:hypothetical protein [Myxococcales bacterium]MDD9966920.1 hypothetical protein [Myxococcales bacterium]
MTEWLTADELMARYRVSEARLLAYAMRGNLPSRRCPNGERQYDESRVSAYFARRGVPLVGLGILGATRVGQAVQSGQSRRHEKVKARGRSQPADAESPPDELAG